MSSVVYLEILDQSNQVISQLISRLDSGIANGQIFLSTDISTGTYLLRAYTAWMRNGNPDDFYQQALNIINPLTELTENFRQSDSPPGRTAVQQTETTSNHILVNTDQDGYQLRELVNLNIRPTLSDSSLSYQFSISVYPFHENLEMAKLTNNLEFSGNSDPPTAKRYFPEITGPVLYGEQSSGAFQHDLMVSINGQRSRLYQVLWRDSTEFLFQLSKEADLQQLYFWSTTAQRPQVNLQSPFDSRPGDVPLNTPKFDSATINFIENQSVNVQVSNLYSSHNQIHGRKSQFESSTVPFYGTPEFQYHLDDYTRFPSLEEAFREYIRYVSLRGRGPQLNMYVWDHYSNNQSLANNIFFDNPALVLLDGIPVQDVNRLLEIDPLEIRSVEVVTKEYLVGNQSFHGVVNLISYNQPIVPDELFTNLQIVPFQSLQDPLEFHHPNYEKSSGNERIPDRRNTLYWQPPVQLSPGQSVDLQFFTGDVAGTYKIEINGISTSGQSIHHTSLITVNGGYQ